MSKTLTIIVSVLAAIMIILLGAVFVLVLQDATSPGAQELPTTVAAVATIAPSEESVIIDVTTPPIVGQMPATFTPPPTIEATNTPIPVTPEPTETASPTNTLPPPTATNTPVPIILPTNTSPPPTNTPIPQPTAPDTRGLVGASFNIQPRSVFQVNQQVWFDFQIINNTGGEVPYYRLGALPKKDGQDRYDWFQQSYGGPRASIKPEGLSHEDNIKLPEAGNYTLRLAICFDSWDGCNSGGGTWVTLSNEIAITIN